MIIDKDKEALGGRVNEGTQALVCRGIPVAHFLQHSAQDDDICDSRMLQEVHLHKCHRNSMFQSVSLNTCLHAACTETDNNAGCWKMLSAWHEEAPD